MKIRNTTTRLYTIERGKFLVDIEYTRGKHGPLFEAWIYQEHSGNKNYMFGLPERQETTGETLTVSQFAEIVYNAIPEYGKIYEQEKEITEAAICAAIDRGEW